MIFNERPVARVISLDIFRRTFRNEQHLVAVDQKRTIETDIGKNFLNLKRLTVREFNGDPRPCSLDESGIINAFECDFVLTGIVAGVNGQPQRYNRKKRQ